MYFKLTESQFAVLTVGSPWQLAGFITVHMIHHSLQDLGKQQDLWELQGTCLSAGTTYNYNQSVPAWQLSQAVEPLLRSPRGWIPSVILTYRRKGPIYIAVHTQHSEPWSDIFEVLQLLMWLRASKHFFLAKEASCAAFCSLPPSTSWPWHCLHPMAQDPP